MQSNRCVDVTIHDLTAAQALEELLRHFRESKKEFVVLMTKRGEGAEFIKRIRVELSKMRAAYKAHDQMIANFGFSQVGPLAIFADGIRKEGYTIKYRITGLQSMKNFAQKVELT